MHFSQSTFGRKIHRSRSLLSRVGFFGESGQFSKFKLFEFWINKKEKEKRKNTFLTIAIRKRLSLQLQDRVYNTDARSVLLQCLTCNDRVKIGTICKVRLMDRVSHC